MRVCKLKDLSRRHGTRIELPDGREIAIFLVDSEVMALSNVCPHQHISMIHEGSVDGGTVSCPMHGRRYRLHDGGCLDPEGGAALPTYPTTLVGDEVHIDPPDGIIPKWMIR